MNGRAAVQAQAAADFERLYADAYKRLEEAVKGTKQYKTKCPNPKCGRDVLIDGFPDVRALTEALKFMHQLGFGPMARQPVQTSVRAGAGADLAALSDAELAALIAAEEEGGHDHGEASDGDEEGAA